MSARAVLSPRSSQRLAWDLARSTRAYHTPIGKNDGLSQPALEASVKPVRAVVVRSSVDLLECDAGGE